MNWRWSSAVQIEIEMPDDLERFRLPEGVQERLKTLLDKQDGGQPSLIPSGARPKRL
jgi:hypothetical protein